ncbi:hypothetical protein [Sphingomonas koreensis]
MLVALAALLMVAQDKPRFPPHYTGHATTCPVGGEAFDAPALMHYSTFGAFPDGQPIGSIEFPVLLAECPGNGLVLYDTFTPEETAKLGPLVASEPYKALRGSETSYYRAAWLAKGLGSKERAAWLLLSATWQAKQASPSGDQARRYNGEFVTAVAELPIDAGKLESIALRARAANALRELGRFDEAEALRASIVIAPDAGGLDDRGAKNRAGWGGYLKDLAAPIARKDATRRPIELMNRREAAGRCLSKEFAAKYNRPAPPPLTAAETEYCARPNPELEAELTKSRKLLQ